MDSLPSFLVYSLFPPAGILFLPFLPLSFFPFLFHKYPLPPPLPFYFPWVDNIPAELAQTFGNSFHLFKGEFKLNLLDVTSPMNGLWGHGLHLNKCTDGSKENFGKLWQTDRPTTRLINQPNNQPTDGHQCSQGSYTSYRKQQNPATQGMIRSSLCY